MHTSATPSAAVGGQPSPAPSAALEKIPVAARRMGLSVSGFYRVAKRDGLQVVKVGERASAAITAEVDAWINARISASKAVAK